jgi:hypothetical protein
MAEIRGTDREIPADISAAAREHGFKKPDVYSGSLVVKRTKVTGHYGGTASDAAKLGNGGKSGKVTGKPAKPSSAGRAAKKGNGIVARALGRRAS